MANEAHQSIDVNGTLHQCSRFSVIGNLQGCFKGASVVTTFCVKTVIAGATFELNSLRGFHDTTSERAFDTKVWGVDMGRPPQSKWGKILMGLAGWVSTEGVVNLKKESLIDYISRSWDFGGILSRLYDYLKIEKFEQWCFQKRRYFEEFFLVWRGGIAILGGWFPWSNLLIKKFLEGLDGFL